MIEMRSKGNKLIQVIDKRVLSKKPAHSAGAAGTLPPYRRKEKGEGRQIINHFSEAGFSGSLNHPLLDNK